MPTPEASPPLIPEALSGAERLCAARGEKLTGPRRDVLGLLLAADRPLAAYDLIQRMQVLRGQTHPPTVYRALDFLERLSLAHRINSRRTYVACREHTRRHQPVFLVCDACQTAVEVCLPEAAALLDALAESYAFRCDRIVQEVQGRCRACLEATASPT